MCYLSCLLAFYHKATREELGTKQDQLRQRNTLSIHHGCLLIAQPMPGQSIHTTFCVRVEFLHETFVGLFSQVDRQRSVGLTGDETVVARTGPLAAVLY